MRAIFPVRRLDLGEGGCVRDAAGVVPSIEVDITFVAPSRGPLVLDDPIRRISIHVESDEGDAVVEVVEVVRPACLGAHDTAGVDVPVRSVDADGRGPVDGDGAPKQQREHAPHAPRPSQNLIKTPHTSWAKWRHESEDEVVLVPYTAIKLNEIQLSQDPTNKMATIYADVLVDSYLEPLDLPTIVA